METYKQPLLRRLSTLSYIGLCICIVLTGAWIRIGPNLQRDYWVDEVWRVQAIQDASEYGEISEPVQLGEYFLTKALWGVLGEQEFTTRLVPCIASILALLLLSIYSWKNFAPAIAVLVSSIVAVSPGLVEHAYEFKPYSIESLFCIASILIFSRIKSQSHLSILLQLAFIAATCFFAFNIVPFLFFIFLPPLFLALREEQPQYLKGGVVVTTLAVVLACYSYYQFMAPLSEAHGMWKFWRPYYLQNFDQVNHFISDRLPYLLFWYVLPIPGLAETPGILLLTLLVFITSIVFLINFLDRNSFFVWLIVPALVMFALAVYGKYPFGTRVSTFYYPVLTLAFGYFLNQVYLYMSVRPKTLDPILQMTLVLVALVIFCNWTPRENPGANRHIQVSKNLFYFLKKNQGKDDILCIGTHASMLMNFYKIVNPKDFRKCKLPTPKKPNRAKQIEFIKELKDRYPEKRTWLLSVHRDKGYEVWKQVLEENDFKIKYDLRRSASYLILAE